MSFKNVSDIKKWVITNERQSASPLLGFLPLFESMTTEISKHLGEDINLESLVEFSSRHVRMACIESEWEQAGYLTLQKLLLPDFPIWVIEGLKRETLHLNHLGNELRSINFNDYSNRELANKMLSTVDSLKRFLVFNNFINTSDFHHELFSKELLNRLEKYNNSDTCMTPSIAYSIFTTPEKKVWIQEEDFDFLNILVVVQSDTVLSNLIKKRDFKNFLKLANKEFQSLLLEHVEKYFWIQYEQEGEVLTTEKFYCKIFQRLDEGIDANFELQEINQRELIAREKLISAKSDFNLNNFDKHLFNVAQQFVYWKLHLREVKVRFYSFTENIFHEISRRLNLDRYQVRHCTVNELEDALLSKISISKTDLNHRIKYCVFHFTKQGTVLHEGKQAKSIFSIVKNDDDAVDADLVTGTCAYPGITEGIVKQVLSVEDIDSFCKGDVLVAYMTDVGVVSAMKKADAIITDVGGVTCHASIIAREFRIPCVIGTKSATKILKTGFKVAVDATAGKVTILSRRSKFSPENKNVDTPDDLINLNLKFPISKTELKNFITFTKPFEEISSIDVNIAGGKGAVLGELSQKNFPVPKGFIILTSAFEHLLTVSNLGLKISHLLNNVNNFRALQAALKRVRELILNVEIPEYLANEIYNQHEKLSHTHVAVRSSATFEDSSDASWAGQMDSFLNTTNQNLLHTVKQCWASLFSERAMLYRLHKNLTSSVVNTAVVIQEMVDSRLSGTAFSVHPVTEDANSVLVESCIGLGETLVLGREIPTTFVVEKNSLKILSKEIHPQQHSLQRSKKGVGNDEVTLTKQESLANALTDTEAKKVATIVANIESDCGFPIDVEWAFEEDNLYILQSRPITTLKNIYHVNE